MKTTLLLLALALPIAASAQKLVATGPPKTYYVGSDKAFLYRTPADTATGKSGSFLYPRDEATVVGEFSPRWAVVKRQGFLYLVSTQKLQDYGDNAVEKKYHELLAQSQEQTNTQSIAPETSTSFSPSFKIEENLPPEDFYAGSNPVPIYRTITDTATKSISYLKPIEKVSVVGEFSPHWAVIKKDNILYITPSNLLLGYKYRQRTRRILSDGHTTTDYNSSTGTGTYHSIQTGPRGGHYYINSNGNKTYVKHK